MKEDAQKRISFFLIPEFPLLSFSAAIDTLRIANRMVGYEYYVWSTISATGGPVTASCGFDVRADMSMAYARAETQRVSRPDAMFVVAGIDALEHTSKSMSAFLRECGSNRMIVGGICTGSLLLAEAGLLNGRRCAVHWEEVITLETRYPEVHVYSELFVQDETIWTCAGGTTPIDFLLTMVCQDLGEAIMAQVRDQQVNDRIRKANDRQLPVERQIATRNKILIEAIEFMEANVEEPLRLNEIAHYMNISRRQIERLFQQHIGMSPARYYLEMRLARAQSLLLQSDMTVVDIAMGCGFVSASHFSKCYRQMYNKTPLQERA